MPTKKWQWALLISLFIALVFVVVFVPRTPAPKPVPTSASPAPRATAVPTQPADCWFEASVSVSYGLSGKTSFQMMRDWNIVQKLERDNLGWKTPDGGAFIRTAIERNNRIFSDANARLARYFGQTGNTDVASLPRFPLLMNTIPNTFPICPSYLIDTRIIDGTTKNGTKIELAGVQSDGGAWFSFTTKKCSTARILIPGYAMNQLFTFSFTFVPLELPDSLTDEKNFHAYYVRKERLGEFVIDRDDPDRFDILSALESIQPPLGDTDRNMLIRVMYMDAAGLLRGVIGKK